MQFDSLTPESITKIIAALTASFAMIGGGLSLYDKVSSKSILTWHPEYFSVSSGPVTGKFNVVVAREKHRDDCSVEKFNLSIKDSKYQVHPIVPNVMLFSGPASHKVDKFGFEFTIDPSHYDVVAKGKAILLAHIVYKCPEGQVIVSYPDHENLSFTIVE